MAEPILLFDPGSHIYRRVSDGAIIPSVTQILRGAGVIQSPALHTLSPAVSDAIERGRLVHEAISLGTDPDQADPRLALYIRGWRLFLAESRARILRHEEMVYHGGLEYAGHADAIGRWRGRHVVIEIKTGHPAPWHRLQTAAYARALGGRRCRMAVYLTPTGSYRLERHGGSEDYAAFVAARRRYREMCGE